jgi:hypothetical protein
MLQVYKPIKYLLVEKMLVYGTGKHFLSPSVTIKMYTSAKYVVTFILTNVRILGATYLRETSSVQVFLGNCIWW